jgi:hypothetical protein
VVLLGLIAQVVEVVLLGLIAQAAAVQRGLTAELPGRTGVEVG